MTTDEQVKFLRSYDYDVAPRDVFMRTTGLPAGLQERASKYPGLWVVFDPNDDSDGFLLVGHDRAALVKEAYEHIDSLLDG